jgi:hypothetical protein
MKPKNLYRIAKIGYGQPMAELWFDLAIISFDTQQKILIIL